MQIEKVRQIKSGFIVNDSMSVPNNPANSDYQTIQQWIVDGGIVEPEFTDAELLQNAKDKKIGEINTYKDQEFGKVLLVRPGPTNYYVKPSPDYNMFLAGSTMLVDQTKTWRAFDVDCNKLTKQDGSPLFLELTRSELMTLSSHYEERKTQEYNQRDLKIHQVSLLTTVEEVEAFDVNQVIVAL